MLIVIANGLSTPSHGWMRASVGHLKPQLNLVFTDLKSFRTPSIREADITYQPAWGCKPPFFRRLCGKLLGKGIATWNAEPKRRIKKFLQDHEHYPLIVHFLDTAVELASLLELHRGPVLVHCHGADFDWGLTNEEGLPLRDAQKYRDECLALVNRVHLIANSTWSKVKLVEGGFPEDRIHINHFGIETPQTASRSYIDGPSKILFLGRLIDCKGPDKLIRAFATAKSNGLRGTLTIAGDGPLRRYCEELSHTLNVNNSVEFLGTVTSAQGEQLRNQSDIFSAHNCTGDRTKRVESFGVSILEAMACGMPVVTGRSGGIVDMVNSGTNGYLFEPNDIDQHARWLLELERNPARRRELGENAKRTVENKFSVQQEVDGIHQIIQTAKSSDQCI